MPAAEKRDFDESATEDGKNGQAEQATARAGRRRSKRQNRLSQLVVELWRESTKLLGKGGNNAAM